MSSGEEDEDAAVNIEQCLRKWHETNAEIAQIENDCEKKNIILRCPDYKYEPARIWCKELLQDQETLLATKRTEQMKLIGHIQGTGDLSPQILDYALKYMDKHLIEFTSTEWAKLMLVNRACCKQVKELTITFQVEIATLAALVKTVRKIQWKGKSYQGAL